MPTKTDANVLAPAGSLLGFGSRRVFAFSCALASALLCACSEDSRTAGGGPSGTEAGNAITASILDLQNAPAASARVILMESESIASGTPVTYNAVTDENGSFTLASIPDGNYTLEVRGNSSALQKSLSFEGYTAIEFSDTLRKLSTIVASQIPGAVGNGRVYVRGLDHSAAVVDGSFTLDSIPSGPISLVFIPESGDTLDSYVYANAGLKLTANTFANETESVLFEDFENLKGRNFQHRIAPAFCPDGGWWYFAHSENVVTEYADSSFLAVSTFPLSIEAYGSVAHAKVLFPEDVAEIAWANLGVQICNKLESADLSTVDSITFDIGGTGNVHFQMLHEVSMDSAEVIGEAEISLGDAMIHHAFAPSEILVSNEWGMKDVTMISWVFTGTAEFMIDNIRFVGADRKSIWHR